MNMVKVFNSAGEHVDSFRKSQKKEHLTRSWNTTVQIINADGYYIRSQLKKLASLRRAAQNV